MVLSERLWRRNFGSDRSILGRMVQFDGSARTVIGVMPANFDPIQNREELWVPIAFTPERRAQHDEHAYMVFGRLKPGVGLQQAQSEMDIVSKQQALKYPDENGDRGIRVTRLGDVLLGPFRSGLKMLLGAVGFVLLIACANIGNLQLARTRSRSRETAVRSALGASRSRLLRQLVVESVVLSFAGGCAGLICAYWGLRFLRSVAPEGIPRLNEASIDLYTIAFMLAATLLSGGLFGVWPAFRAAFSNPDLGFGEGVWSSTPAVRDRLRSILVIAEVALALILLVDAGLLMRSAWLLSQVNVGFDSTHLLIGRVSLPVPQYRDPQLTGSAFQRILEETQSVAGVETAALVSNAPLESGSSNGLVPEGKPLEAASAIDSRFSLVSEGYFRALRLPVRRGRVFTEADRRGSTKVMVINETLARQAFGLDNPIGKRFACCETGANNLPDWKEVIGVVGDVHAWGLDQDVKPEFYLPLKQAPPAAWDWTQRSMDVVVRSAGDASSLSSFAQRAVSNVDPGVPLYGVETMDRRIAGSLAQFRFSMLVMSLFAGIALLLAFVGIYGVLSYLVAQRSHEIGIRMAIGAKRADVVRLVLQQGLKLTLIGVAIGVVGEVVTSHAIGSFLFGVKPIDFTKEGAVVLLLVFVALLACYLPARRAASVDPILALRRD